LPEDEQTSKHGGGGRYTEILGFKGSKLKKEEKKEKKEERKKEVSIKKKYI
jgi:hypothetical protein